MYYKSLGNRSVPDWLGDLVEWVLDGSLGLDEDVGLSLRADCQQAGDRIRLLEERDEEFAEQLRSAADQISRALEQFESMRATE